jgi:hypothetical protein
MRDFHELLICTTVGHDKTPGHRLTDRRDPGFAFNECGPETFQ